MKDNRRNLSDRRKKEKEIEKIWAKKDHKSKN